MGWAFPDTVGASAQTIVGALQDLAPVSQAGYQFPRVEVMDLHGAPTCVKTVSRSLLKIERLLFCLGAKDFYFVTQPTQRRGKSAGCLPNAS